MLNHAPGGARLSFGYEDVAFPRMNYRRKKISMKSSWKKAIEEIGRERRKKGSASYLLLPSAASLTLRRRPGLVGLT
jgi:hypothetical protein